ncbi:EamA family transporter [Serratia oryzae]|uniref:Uncharacterized protein n=1 Tax=Serratia oryzae TaxID=2034155 RepID=A0A1S8CIS5_9GAMM|nr:hypothetical protein BMI79_10660 [Serratia oryzae]
MGFMSFLFPLFAVLIWSINVVNKASTDVIDPATISFYRWLLAFIVLMPFVLAWVLRNRVIVLYNRGRGLIIALLEMVLYQSPVYIFTTLSLHGKEYSLIV